MTNWQTVHGKNSGCNQHSKSNTITTNYSTEIPFFRIGTYDASLSASAISVFCGA